MDRAVLDVPLLFADLDPPGEILAVEKGNPAGVRGAGVDCAAPWGDRRTAAPRESNIATGRSAPMRRPALPVDCRRNSAVIGSAERREGDFSNSTKHRVRRIIEFIIPIRYPPG
jgi:hypothetical protein